MKRFHKNYRKIENEVFILYMPDRELVTASNLKKNTNCFELSIFGMEYLRKPQSNLIPGYLHEITLYLFLSKSLRGLS